MIMLNVTGSRRLFKAVISGYIVQEPHDTDDDLIQFIGQSIDVDPVAGVRLDDGVEVMLDTEYNLVELSVEEARFCELAITLVSLGDCIAVAEHPQVLEDYKRQWNDAKEEYERLWALLGKSQTERLQTKLKEA